MGKICIIPVIGVIFGQTLGIWPPGVPIYRITLHCFAINFEETQSCIVLWLVYIIKLIKLWSYLHNTNIWGHFGQNLAIWPPGVPIYRANPYCCAINFEKMTSCSIENAVLRISSNVKVGKIMIICKKWLFSIIFDRFLKILPPGGCNLSFFSQYTSKIVFRRRKVAHFDVLHSKFQE